jgi:hypothetical protein
MKRGIFSILKIAIAIGCLGVLPSSAQKTTLKPPTAAQAAIKNQKPSKKGVKRGTTNSTRWQVATKNADRRAAQHSAANKGVK